LSSITEAEENEFRSISFDIVRDTCREIQTDQEREQNLMYMQRLEPFLVSMQQLGGIAEATSLSTKIQSLMAYVWVRHYIYKVE
jgi:hypothetical protein